MASRPWRAAWQGLKALLAGQLDTSKSLAFPELI